VQELWWFSYGLPSFNTNNVVQTGGNFAKISVMSADKTIDITGYIQVGIATDANLEL
jgi:hypothetical protein